MIKKYRTLIDDCELQICKTIETQNHLPPVARLRHTRKCEMAPHRVFSSRRRRQEWNLCTRSSFVGTTRK